MSDIPAAESEEDRDIILEPFRSISESLDWRLREAYWSVRGGQAFLSGEVPSLTINDGVLAVRVSDALYTWFLELEAGGRTLEQIRVLEIGAGQGASLEKCLVQEGYEHVEVQQDVAGCDRIVAAIWGERVGAGDSAA